MCNGSDAPRMVWPVAYRKSIRHMNVNMELCMYLDSQQCQTNLAMSLG